MGWQDAPLAESSSRWQDAPLADNPNSNEPLSVTRNGKTLTASNKTFKDDLKDELAANPIAAKMAAAGTALSDLYQGGKQIFGAEDKQQMQANKIIREANPLSAIGGNVAMFGAGGVLAPILNTVKGAAALGTTVGALAPVEGEDVARQKVGSALLGGGLGAGITKGAQGIFNSLTNSKAAQSALQTKNATRDASLKTAKDLGLNIPRSMYNPSFLSNRVESLGGKAAVKQMALDNNQPIVDSLVKKAIGVSDDVALSDDLLRGLRTQAAAPYRGAEQLAAEQVGTSSTRSMATGQIIQTPIIKDGKQLVQEINEARDVTRALWADSKSATGTARNAAREAAKASEARLSTLESQLDKMAINQGNPQLVKELSNARKQIAKLYTVDDALNKGTGSIDATSLGKKFAKNKPLDGELKEIGRFANAFQTKGIVPKGGMLSGADISALEPLSSAIYSSVGSAATGNATGMLLGGVPLLRGPARSLALSGMMRSTPNYNQAITPRLLEGLLSSRYAPMAITGATVPTFTK